jgi:hypothetical protein
LVLRSSTTGGCSACRPAAAASRSTTFCRPPVGAVWRHLNGTAPGRHVHPHYPLLRAPRRYLTAFSITPVIVGLAVRALDLTSDMLKSRLHAGAAPDDFEVVQQKLAESAAEVKTANLILDTHLRQSVEALDANAVIGDAEIAHNRLMASYMMRLSKQAVERLCSISARAGFDGHPMQVILRDTLAGATHRSYNGNRSPANTARASGLRAARTPIGLQVGNAGRSEIRGEAELPRSQRNPRRHADRLGHADQDGRRPGPALRCLSPGQAGQIRSF